MLSMFTVDYISIFCLLIQKNFFQTYHEFLLIYLRNVNFSFVFLPHAPGKYVSYNSTNQVVEKKLNKFIIEVESLLEITQKT